MSYSVAIRALKINTQLVNELKEIFNQSLRPDKVYIFLPEGEEIPLNRVNNEEYIHVTKGMMSQRLLPYNDISSDYILMLDDDVMLKYDSIENLIRMAQENNTDLLGVDTFHNHKLSFSTKLRAGVTNFVFPHFSQQWAFKIHINGSFSYLNDPKKNFYSSQSCAGNVMLWKTITYRMLRMQDELWLDLLPFSYGDDMLESYKVYKNGFKLGVVFNSGIRHLDTKSASSAFQASPAKIRIRTLAQFAVWWRTCFKPGDTGFFSQFFAAFAFTIKMFWLFIVFLILSIFKLNISYIYNFLTGIFQGWKLVHSDSFRVLTPYVVR